MGFFEDLIASLQGFNKIEVDPISMYSGPDITDTRAKLYRDAVERLGGTESLMGNVPEDEGSWFSRTPLGQDLAKYTSNGKLQLPFEPGPALAGIAEKKSREDEASRSDLPLLGVDPMRAKAREKIEARQSSEQEEVAKAAAHEAEKQRLLEAAGIKNQQREFMQGTVPLIEDYDNGIAIGGIPGRGGRDEILARIRAQALAKGGGTVGAGGGTFSQGTMTPEIQQRLDDRDAWTAEQPMRDAAFALSPQQLRKNPEGAAGAEYLRRIGQDQMETVRRERASQMLQKFVGPSGKIPADAARKLAMMDPIFAQIIPPDAIGMSREQASEMIDAELMSAQQIAMSSAGNMEDMAKPIKIELVNRVYPLAEAAKKRIAMGEDPELVMQDYRSKVSAINYELMQSPMFQQLIGSTQLPAGE